MRQLAGICSTRESLLALLFVTSCVSRLTLACARACGTAVTRRAGFEIRLDRSLRSGVGGLVCTSYLVFKEPRPDDGANPSAPRCRIDGLASFRGTLQTYDDGETGVNSFFRRLPLAVLLWPFPSTGRGRLRPRAWPLEPSRKPTTAGVEPSRRSSGSRCP